LHTVFKNKDSLPRKYENELLPNLRRTNSLKNTFL
jgi:hypothetical protein